MSKIWPWSRIAELEQQVRSMNQKLTAQTNASAAQINKLGAVNDVLHEKLMQARRIEGELRRTLATAHIRDPKTGRILPKGKMPS